MMSNNLYNLMTQLTQEHKSLWRIRKEYQKDAGKDMAVKKLWMKLAKEKEMQITELQALVKKMMK